MWMLEFLFQLTIRGGVLLVLVGLFVFAVIVG